MTLQHIKLQFFIAREYFLFKNTLACISKLNVSNFKGIDHLHKNKFSLLDYVKNFG